MISLKLSLKKLISFTLFVLFIVGIGWGGWSLAQKLLSNASKVRVTNISGRSATVSWVTDRPDSGVVYVKENNNISMFGFGTLKGYDDRDYAKAQLNQYEKAILKGDDEGGVESVSGEDIVNVKVRRLGQYYVHHATVLNLQPNTQYFFRISNGIKVWNANSVGSATNEFDLPVTETFSFKTFDDPVNLQSPDPAYGKVYTLDKDEDGALINNPGTDAVVFVKSIKESSKAESLILSSVTNTDGGWVVDKSNLRNQSGEIESSLEEGVDKLEVATQFENLESKVKLSVYVGIEDSPTEDIVGYGDENIKVSWIKSNIQLVKEKVGEIISNNFGWVVKETSAASCLDNCKQIPVGPARDACEKSCPATPTPTPAPTPTPSPIPTTKAKCGDGKCETGETATCPRDCRSTPPAVEPKPSNTQPEEKCEGYYSTGCERPPKDYCFQKCTRPNGYTYNKKVEGMDCRPASCANVARGEAVCDGGVCTVRSKTGTNNCIGQECLCDSEDYTTPGCAGSNEKVGKKVCERLTDDAGKTIYVYNPKTKSCDSKARVGEGTLSEPTAVPAPSSIGIVCAVNALQNAGKSVEKTSECCEKGYKCGRTGVWVKKSCADGYFYSPDDNKCIKPKPRATNVDLMCPEKLPVKIISADGSSFECTTEKQLDNWGEGNQIICCLDVKGSGTYPNKLKQCELKKDKVVEPYYCSMGANVCCKNTNTGKYVWHNVMDRCTYPTEEFVSYDKNDCKGSDSPVASEEKACYRYTSIYGGHSVYTRAWITPSEVQASDLTIQEGLTQANCGYCCQSATADGKSQLQKYECKTYNQTSLDPSMCLGVQGAVDVNTASVLAETTQDGSSYVNYFVEPGVYSLTKDDKKYVYSLNSKDPTVLYLERNGVKGYQSPNDPNNVKKNEDLLVDMKSANIKLSKVSSGYDLSLKEGYNIVSFNAFLSNDTKKALMASDLLKIANVGQPQVLYVSYFEGGKWASGLRVNPITGEILGTDFPLVFGRGYVIKASLDTKFNVPSVSIKESIPVAFSAGWNLIGVNGYTKSFTAVSLIDSVNELPQLTADNVTWWPTSKGRYETFQKSQGVEYGFDFPIAKDLGYFVRISNFDPDDTSHKSVIWNPAGQLHGQPGSGK